MNSNCTCMHYSPGDFSANCRVCGMLPKYVAGTDPYKEDSPVELLDEAGQWQNPKSLYGKGLWKQLPPESIISWSIPKELKDLNKEDEL